MDYLTLITNLLQLIANPKTSEAVIELAKQAIELGIALRDRVEREGSFAHQDALDAFNVQMRQRFSAILTKALADGVIDNDEHREIAAAYEDLLAGLKLLPP